MSDFDSARWQEMFGLTQAPIPATAATGDTGLALASTASPGEGGAGGAGGAGRLKHTRGPWASASNTAGELRTNTEKSRRVLRPAHQGIARGAAGLTSVAALMAVLTSWEDRLMAVRDECAYLDGASLRVARELGRTDTGVGDSIPSARKAGEAG
ncbi:hypothetical protein ACIBCM_15025 [Streptomyces sp. NPDC051018]|uniref:hypothetical protein n=1 Tax=Streptomyces sp. NPDC051018 TaxID=3365639 RepID=UPI0037ACD5EF